ncbi:MAG: PHP domain-containing protein [Desulfurococcaceae archaeon]
MSVLIRADLHTHSTFSDGKASPLEIVYVAGDRALGAVSITDHDTFRGSIVAKKLAITYGILVIPGAEMRTDRGDILVYCDREVDLPKRISLLIEKAHEENCLVVPAHPFDFIRLGIGDLVYEYQVWDAIEVWNASSTKGANYQALEAAKMLNKPGIANSDAHIPEEVGSAYTLIEVDDLTVDSVLEAIRRNRVKPFLGRVPLKARFNRLVWSIERSLIDALR